LIYVELHPLEEKLPDGTVIQFHEGYARRNLPRALSATRKNYAKNYAHVLANASETKRRNEAVAGRQNENPANSKSA